MSKLQMTANKPGLAQDAL